MYYKNSASEHIQEGLWWEESCVRRQAGYDLDVTNLPSTLRWFPKGAVLAFVPATGKAKLVKTFEVYETANANATTLKVKDPYGLAAVGDTIAGKEVSAVSLADGVATLTIAALAAKLNAGDVVADASASGTLLGLNYATVDLRDNDYPSVTPTLQAYEIEEDTLPFPVNSTIKQGLGDRHQFKII